MPIKKTRKLHNFRLSPEITEQVEAYLERTGISATQFFTEATVEKLSSHSQDRVLQELQQARRDIAEERRELAEFARVTLIMMAEKIFMNREDVDEWVTENMKGRRT